MHSWEPVRNLLHCLFPFIPAHLLSPHHFPVSRAQGLSAHGDTDLPFQCGDGSRTAPAFLTSCPFLKSSLPRLPWCCFSHISWQLALDILSPSKLPGQRASGPSAQAPTTLTKTLPQTPLLPALSGSPASQASRTAPISWGSSSCSHSDSPS